ncbi:MAG: hypothetical protein V5789_12690 [Colwellia sp.]
MKTYDVEIRVSFEARIEYEFSQDEISDAEDCIEDMFDHLESELMDSIPNCLIYFCAKKVSAKNLYLMEGTCESIFNFDEKDVDCEELIDGTFESNLKSMRLVLEHSFGESGFDINLTHFEWQDDEVICEYSNDNKQ